MAGKSGKKGRKIGRAARRPSTKAYKAENRSELNQLKKHERHMKKHPNDTESVIGKKVVYPKLKKEEKPRKFIPGGRSSNRSK